MLRHKAGIRTWPSLPERFKGPSGPSRSLAKKDSAKGKLHQEPKMNSGESQSCTEAETNNLL